MINRKVVQRMAFENYKAEKRYYEREATEEEFLAWYHTQDHGTYEKPSVTVDNLIFGWEEDQLKVLFIKRKAHPFIDQYAFAGGFLNKQESPDEAAIREAVEETGIQLDMGHLKQFKTVGTPNRDPRGWVVTIAYLVFLPTMDNVAAKAGGDAKDAIWLSLNIDGEGTPRLNLGQEEIPLSQLAFDHEEILRDAATFMREHDLVVKVLGPNPSLSSVQKLKRLLGL